MSKTERFAGVLTPVITPFKPDFSPDPDRLVQQCRWMLSQNVGLAIFGTNSEANSLTTDEKLDLIDRLVDADIDAGAMMPGTGCCALPDSIRLTEHAVKAGCRGVLMLPPFYYKSVSDDGLFASYAEVIERVGSERLQIYLYHIPPVAQVGISLDLIDRLIKAYPGTIAGVKDSSGDWGNTKAMLNAGWDDFRVFAGSESFLLQNMRNGGAGCISATANDNPAAIHNLYANWRSDEADQLQDGLNVIRGIFQKHPMIPALKKAAAHYSEFSEWSIVRPPLVALTEAQETSLLAELQEQNFNMPGLADITGS